MVRSLPKYRSNRVPLRHAKGRLVMDQETTFWFLEYDSVWQNGVRRDGRKPSRLDRDPKTLGMER